MTSEIKECAATAKRNHNGDLRRVEKKFGEAAAEAHGMAEETLEDLTDALKVQTLKAIVSRDGSYSNRKASYNFTEAIAQPFIQAISETWTDVIVDRDEDDVFLSFETEMLKVAKSFIHSLSDTAARSSPSRCATIAETSLKTIKTQLRRAERRLYMILSIQQKEAHRKIAPSLQRAWAAPYAAAAAESGKGSLVRMNDGLCDFVRHNQRFYGDAGAEVMKCLRQADDEIANTLQEVAESVTRVLSNNFSTLFVPLKPGNPRTLALRSRVFEAAGKELEQVNALLATMGPAPALIMQGEEGDVSDGED